MRMRSQKIVLYSNIYQKPIATENIISNKYKLKHMQVDVFGLSIAV